MIEKIFNEIYRIKIPLPNNPLKATNSYFIRGKERNLLIDTGFNRIACREAMADAIKEIGFSMKNTDIFITHLHSDHSGLVGYLALPETKVYSGKYCVLALSKGSKWPNWSYFGDLIKQSGLIDMGLSTDPSMHPGYKFASDIYSDAIVVGDGDEIKVGNFTLQCVETTGHAPNHICLYEPKYKILFSGDHILGKITPNNTIWGAPWTIGIDYLGEYLNNLNKVADLKIELVLPGHREFLIDCYSRIKELKKHHQKRLENVLDILKAGAMNGAQVASLMEWDLNYKSWDEFPPPQKIFATGEALSHLTHLVFKGILAKELFDGVVYYRKV